MYTIVCGRIERTNGDYSKNRLYHMKEKRGRMFRQFFLIFFLVLSLLVLVFAQRNFQCEEVRS